MKTRIREIQHSWPISTKSWINERTDALGLACLCALLGPGSAWAQTQGQILTPLPVSTQASLPGFNIQRYTRDNPINFPLYDKVSTPEQAKGASFFDPNYGLAVIKAVDAHELPSDETRNVVRPVYSRWRIENSAGDLYFLVKNGETPPSSGRGQTLIYRTKDDSLFRIVSEEWSNEGAEFRWDYSGEHPEIMYFVRGAEFREYDVRTGFSTLIRDFSLDFPECRHLYNDVEGDSSGDSRYWAWKVKGDNGNDWVPMIAVIAYDKKTDRILGVLDDAKYHALGGKESSLPTPNMVDISPLGTKVVCLFPRTDAKDVFDGPHAFDLDFSRPIKVGNDETHSGWGFDYAGQEVYVTQVDNSNWPNADADTLAYTDIQTGETHSVLYHKDLGWDVGGFHFGRFYSPKFKGWIYMTTYSDYATSVSWLRNQACMIELKPYDQHPRIWRIADTHNNYPGNDGYMREAYSPISADGQTTYWGADWPDGDGTVDTYKVRLPDQWWITLNEARDPLFLTQVQWKNGALEFTINGAPDLHYLVQTTVDFTQWTTLTNVTATNATVPFRDVQKSPQGQRFYRVLAP